MTVRKCKVFFWDYGFGTPLSLQRFSVFVLVSHLVQCSLQHCLHIKISSERKLQCVGFNGLHTLMIIYHTIKLQNCNLYFSVWRISSSGWVSLFSLPFCITNMARFSLIVKTFNYLFLLLLCQICAHHPSLWTNIYKLSHSRLKTTNRHTMWLITVCMFPPCFQDTPVQQVHTVCSNHRFCLDIHMFVMLDLDIFF